jgi:hypothetical protein
MKKEGSMNVRPVTVRIAALSGRTNEQKHVVAASFLGWTLDAFDFVLLLFVLKDIALEFKTETTDVTFAVLLNVGDDGSSHAGNLYAADGK